MTSERPLLPGRIVALLVSVGVHVLLVAPALSSSKGTREGQLRGYGSATAAALEVAWIAPADPVRELLHFPPVTVQIQTLSLQLQPVGFDLTPSDDAPSAGDDYVHRMAALTARIQALWKLPRARLGGDFRCLARLRTSESGSVDEVELENCDESGPVRASIAEAIQHAMPLSLPSGGSADIVLQFIAFAEANGASHTSIAPAAN